MPFELQPTALADIDADDTTFRITTENHSDDLTASIGQVGLLCAPILSAGAHGLRVVSGFRRLAACRRLGLETVAARRPRLPDDPWRLAGWAVAENAAQRPLNPVETGRALRLLKRYAPDPDHLRAALRDFGLPDNPAAARRFAALCDLPADVQQAVARGALSLATADILGRLTPAEAKALADLLVRLRLGSNKQREVLEMIAEIAAREAVGIERLIEETAVPPATGGPGYGPGAGSSAPAQRAAQAAVSVPGRCRGPFRAAAPPIGPWARRTSGRTGGVRKPPIPARLILRRPRWPGSAR